MRGASLIVTCHPSRDSLCGRIARTAERALRDGGETVIVDDLCHGGFNPILSPEEFKAFYEKHIPDDLETLVAHLRQATYVIFVLPIWMYDMPALLKGYFDRVWRPHVAYRMDGDRIEPLLTNIKRLLVIATHGRDEAETMAAGDATSQFFSVSLPTLLPDLESNERFDFFALDAPDASVIEEKLNGLREHVLMSARALSSSGR